MKRSSAKKDGVTYSELGDGRCMVTIYPGSPHYASVQETLKGLGPGEEHDAGVLLEALERNGILVMGERIMGELDRDNGKARWSKKGTAFKDKGPPRLT